MMESIEFYKLGIKLGLCKKDIDQLLIDNPSREEQTFFSLGPPYYPGGRYGTFSIKVFY